MPDSSYDVVIVGGGVAGLSAGTFTARHGLETIILDTGGSLLRRNAHLENFPGFPAGVDSRLLLDMMLEQAKRAGCEYRLAEVTRVEEASRGFDVETEEGERYLSTYVIAATKNTTAYLEHLAGVGIVNRGQNFVETDERGRTGVRGLYAAGRLARKPHQAVVSAGHGAEVAVALLEDDERPFFHDWVAPSRYFTGRDLEVPPGCEEIDEAERRRRERESLEFVRENFREPHPGGPEQHPNVDDE